MLLENLQIKPETLPDVEQVDFKQHPDRYRTLRLINLIITFTLLAAAWIIALFNNVELGFQIGLIIVWLIALAIFLVEEIKSFAIRGYALRQHDITYRKGFFKFSVTTVPFNRIQHSEISQGPVARLFKLSTLKIYTAGGSSSDLKIGGLEPEEAKQLRDFIAKEAGKHA